MTIYGLIGFFFIWILILSWVVWQIKNYIKNNRVYGNQDIKLHQDIEAIKKNLNEVIKQSKLHLQKIGIIKFNPEQSFVIALLDQENNGLTANFIYTHDGLRVYTKKVKAGKGVEYDLSKEELKAIENSI